MMDFAPAEVIEPSSETRGRAGRSRREPLARPCGVGATIAIQPDEFRAELACFCQAGLDEQLEPYEEGFAAYASGTGLADNPYHGDNCAHQKWANGWSQARDEAQRQAR